MMRWLATLGVLAVPAYRSYCQTIKGAECGKSGNAQRIYADGKTKQQPKESGQVGCDHVVIADDRQTAGWSVLIDSCCTSYPIPLSVVVINHGRKRVFWPEQTVWEWTFVSGGRKLALLSGPVHGGAANAILYDVRSGRRLTTWNGGGHPPTWASGWKDEFGPA